MSVHQTRDPSERGTQSGVFDVQSRSIEAPCAAVLAEELRKIAVPQVAVVWIAPTGTLAEEISIANPGGLVRSQLEGIPTWLRGVENIQKLSVPSRWLRKLNASRVVAMPILSPVEQLGVAAFPVQGKFEPIRRLAERCLSDFALRLEHHQRHQQLLELQHAVRAPQNPPPPEDLFESFPGRLAANG